MRRSQQHPNPGPAAPSPGGSPAPGSASSESTPTKIRKPTPQIRPQSAFIPPATRKSADTRRRSDFVSRYESLLSRAQAATKAVDELDLLRLQRAKVDNTSTTNTSSASVNFTPNASTASPDNNDNLVDDNVVLDDEDDEVTSVDFNEDEVLQRCQ